MTFNKLVVAIAALFFAGTAMAAELNGEVTVDFAKNASDNVVATTGIDLDINVDGLAFSTVSIIADPATGDISLDKYSIGTIIGNTVLSFGKQDDLFASQGLEVVGGETLASPNDDLVSLRVGVDALAVQLGFEDVGTDVTNVENIQAAYGLQLGVVSVDTAIDYNFNSEDATLLVGLAYDADIAVTSLAVSYTDVAVGYELVASRDGVTVFANGDDSNALQNIGAGYAGEFNTMGYYVEAGYNVDTEVFTPAVGVSFSF